MMQHTSRGTSVHRRCVCGRSAVFPICDGSHGSGWECSAGAAQVALCVVAGPHLQSLAERLAHERSGVAAHRIEGAVRAERLIVLTDGLDLDLVESALGRITATNRVVVVVDAPTAVVASRFAGWEVRSAHPEDPLHLWRAVSTALKSPAAPKLELPTVFLSHAVADEAVLQPILDYLRDWTGVELFSCADSIPSGTEWRARIQAALVASERFVLVGSEASFRSTYCAFEVGFAMALEKSCRVVVLDGSPPPAFISHVQATDAVRHRHRRPWLTPQEAIMDVLLDALG